MSEASFTTITAVCWSFTGVAVAMSIGRFYIRAKIIKNFYWDDLCHLFATIFLIIIVSVYTYAIPLLMQIRAFEHKESNQLPDYNKYLDINVANTIMAFSCWWSVKFAFLFYYRLIFQVSRPFLRAWWAVFVFTLLTFWVIVAGTIVQCGGSAAYIHDHPVCVNDSSVTLQRRWYIYAYVFNITSDFTTMMLPMPYLWKIKTISRSKKIGISAIFSLTSVVIAFESLRLAESISGTASSNNSIWINVEGAVAVVISCLPTYSVLLSLPSTEQDSTSDGASNANAFSIRKPRSDPSFANSRSFYNDQDMPSD